MEKEHMLTEHAMQKMESAIAAGWSHIAYNGSNYYISARDIEAFKTKREAIIYASLHDSKDAGYRIFHVSSIADVFEGLYQEKNIQQQILNNKNANIMNEENLAYLKENLRYMGFGDKLNSELENNIKNGAQEIQLKATSSFNGQEMEAMLSFRKGEQNEMYFFNKYAAAIVKDGGPDLERSQTFYINRGNGVTFKEAFNLLEGRAVNKNLSDAQGNKYNAWLQLDFGKKDVHGNHEVKQYHQNYGYDLEKTLSKLPIKEMDNVEDRKLLIGALKKGNLWEASLERGGAKEKIFIEANPKFKTLNVFDSAKKPVKLESLSQEKSKEESKDKEEKKENKQERGKRRSKDELDNGGQSQQKRTR